MGLLKTSRKLHKWLMAFIGLQFIIWSISGAYMVFLNIDYIHGDTLVNNVQDKIDPQQIHYPLQSLFKQYPQATNVILDRYLDKTVYRFSLDKQKMAIDANSGQPIEPLDRTQAEKAARFYYSGVGEIKTSELILENPPFELSARVLPAWRVNFAELGAPAIYISAETGQLVGKRHDFWRLFDWMFRFHVMDYDDGEDLDNNLLLWFSALGILSSVLGMVLVYFRVFRQKDSESRASETEQLGAVGVAR
ncbi:PepSY domain-containing protein [Shewanella sp. AS1]|uniref:PepSY domain-containing protein n=1 Tax=Shewanella sp. AS1 TaxID=2907626 RepID=UPI001F2D3156|nr:PepSY domain-containing protein [Shewanella sp. AS1]MCE9678501.1 PepSY domain-containing protein [Shewanella sp. AS1]